jgi:predicted DNA-binding transcriptional regulator YafY
MNSAVKLGSKNEAFEVNLIALDEHESEANEEVLFASILLRKGKVPSLRSEGRTTEHDSEWDLVEVPYQDSMQLVREVLWAGDNAIVLAPDSLREQVIDSLKKVVAIHG